MESMHGIAYNSCPASGVRFFVMMQGAFLGVMEIAVDMVIKGYMTLSG